MYQGGNIVRDLPSVTVVGWNMFTDAVMGAFVIIASTLIPGDTFHSVFIKEGLGLGTLWIAA